MYHIYLLPMEKKDFSQPLSKTIIGKICKKNKLYELRKISIDSEGIKSDC